MWNMLGAFLPIAIGALSVPYLLRHLGIERFGILTLLWTIVGYASLFDLGLGRAATQQIASRIALGKEADIAGVISTATLLTTIIGVVFGLLLAGCSGLLAGRVLHVSAANVADVREALLIVSLGIPMATLSNGLRGAAEAFRRFADVNLVKIITGTAIFLLPLCGTWIWGGGLATVAIMLVCARLLGLLLFMRLRRQLPYDQTSLVRLSASESRGIALTGLWMSISGVISPLLIYMDRFLIANILGAVNVAYYTTPFEILVRLLILPAAIGSSLFPRFSAQYSTEPHQARQLFTTLVKRTALIMAALCMGCAFLIHPVLTYFASPEFANRSDPVVYVLLIGIFFNGLANIPYTALHSIGSVRFTGALHVTELICYVPVLVVLLKTLGLPGAALAWTLRTAADCGFLFAKYWRLNR